MCRKDAFDSHRHDPSRAHDSFLNTYARFLCKSKRISSLANFALRLADCEVHLAGFIMRRAVSDFSSASLSINLHPWDIQRNDWVYEFTTVCPVHAGLA